MDMIMRRLNFHETFNVLLPESVCNKVSCCVSLCGKNKLGKDQNIYKTMAKEY